MRKFPQLSRRELANTLCEWFEWERPNGKPKGQEAAQWLEKLEQRRYLTLPSRKNKGAKGQLPRDWMMIYGVEPQLIETMVDINRFKGTCYRAANYIYVGVTSGRGRQDRFNNHHGKAVKAVWLLPISKRAAKNLQM